MWKILLKMWKNQITMLKTQKNNVENSVERVEKSRSENDVDFVEYDILINTKNRKDKLWITELQIMGSL